MAEAGKAILGSYVGSYTDSAVGAVTAYRFKALDSYFWNSSIIQSIKITFTFGTSDTQNPGYADCDFTIYASSTETFPNTSNRYAGQEIASFTGWLYNVKWYGEYGRTTIDLSPSQNVVIFDALADYIRGHDNPCLIVKASKGDSETARAMYLNVDYIMGAPGGTLSSYSVPCKESVSLTIDTLPDFDAANCTYTLTWACGSASSAQKLAQGVTSASFTIPAAWANQITGERALATCTISGKGTYTPEGSDTATTVTFSDAVMEFYVLPAIVYYAPTFDFTVAASSLPDGGYYQYLTGATVSISNIATDRGATITAYSITGTDGASGTSDTLTSPTFQTGGKVTYTAKITDSRGNVGVRTLTISVNALSVPAPSAFDVSRYAQVEGTEDYEDDNTGDHVRVTLSLSLAALSAITGNAATAWILYNPISGGVSAQSEPTRVDLTLSDGATALVQDRALISETIGTNADWEFTLYCGDLPGMAIGYARVSKGRANVHFAGSGYGVGFGCFVNDTDADNPRFECAYPAKFSGAAGLTAQGRNITITNVDLTAGTSPLATGEVVLVYE